MFNGLKIKNLIESRGLMFKDVFTAADMTRPTFDSIVKENANPTVRNVEALADILRCPIDDFFDRNIDLSGDNTTVIKRIDKNSLQNEIEHLHQLLAEKERTIQILLNQNK